MDAWNEEPKPGSQPDEEPGQVIWLFDPEADGPGPLACSPVELFAMLDAAAGRMGLGDVAVTGVIGGLRRRGRWCSFELAGHQPGQESPEALVRVVLFAAVASRVDAALAEAGRELRDGMGATVSGAVRFDPAWGGVRLVGRDVAIHEERAEVAARRDVLVEELTTSGLAAAQAALVVPGRPLHIGVIAGAGTAGDADVQALLDASGLEWRLTRRSVAMAGPGAPPAVADALAQLGRVKPDVIVVARGGGGRGELACWDSETVARAIAACPVPVWTAIGHATDATVADRMANRSCATPSAAAAALVERVRDFERRRHERVVLRAHGERVAAIEAGARRARIVAALAVMALVVLLVLLAR
ncbi:MAG: hypothetical protein KY447_13170 [Actinobacteria bacterium]|nr:hypothetical protein [Actinomycetota bacterium]